MSIKRFDFRILLGGGLILLGGLQLLEQVGLLKGASGWFWALALALVGVFFMRLFVQNMRSNWWAVIPAFAVFGMAADTIVPENLSIFSGMFFLGALGLAFWTIYGADHSRWWAIIPGGVLLTLAAVNVFDNFLPANSEGSESVFFIGLGFTFLLVALLPNPLTDTRWAYIPAAALVLIGAFVASTAVAGLANYIWPLALIGVGLGLIGGFFLKK
ncbi:MAG: hypothetical protein RBS68_03415 [Anaerolineales bacterium]|jgi:hypothetical protein|nr:hypothetical protein [Anaerolineales bacterium]